MLLHGVGCNIPSVYLFTYASSSSCTYPVFLRHNIYFFYFNSKLNVKLCLYGIKKEVSAVVSL